MTRRRTWGGCRRIRGRRIGFRASRSGSMRRVRVRRHPSTRGRRSRRIRRTTTGIMCTAPVVAASTGDGQRPRERLRRTRSACTTCMATCASGRRTAGMLPTRERRATGRHGRGVEVVVVVCCCAAVRGTTLHGTSVRPIASGAPPGLGAPTPVFACRGRSISSMDGAASRHDHGNVGAAGVWRTATGRRASRRNLADG